MAEFKTKYSIGDKVYYVVTVPGSYEPKVCEACNCNGYIIHNGHKFICSECDGSGLKYEWLSEISVIHYSTIGNIKIDSYEDNITIQYMLKHTGVRSGALWHEDEIFKTREEAEKYIESKKNG